MIRVYINGAGKMGKLAARNVEQDPKLELVGIGQREDDLAANIKQTNAQVVVDFTTSTAAYDNTRTIIDAGVHPVIGTSGLLPEQITELQRQCREQQLGGIIAANFSISVVLMMQFAQQAARHLPHVEIIELHHDKKKDAPSGTAIKTATMIAQNRDAATTSPCHEVLAGARGATQDDIPIHSVRLPGLLAHQQIIFGSPGETLTLKHDTIDRQCFMPGVVLACKKVVNLNELVNGLEYIID